MKIIYADQKEKWSQHRPQGTPDETGISSDEDPFTMTDWWRLSRDPLTHLRAEPLKWVIKRPFDPFKSRTSYTIVMQFESKFLVDHLIKGLAEVKQNYFFLQTDLKRSMINMRSWDSHECFSLKPCCSSQYIFSLSRCLVIEDTTIYVFQGFTKNTSMGYLHL